MTTVYIVIVVDRADCATGGAECRTRVGETG